MAISLSDVLLAAILAVLIIAAVPSCGVGLG